MISKASASCANSARKQPLFSIPLQVANDLQFVTFDSVLFSENKTRKHPSDGSLLKRTARHLIHLHTNLWVAPRQPAKGHLGILLNVHQYRSDLVLQSTLERFQLREISAAKATGVQIEQCLLNWIHVRLSPTWNLVRGGYLIKGENFFTAADDDAPFDAVKLDLQQSGKIRPSFDLPFQLLNFCCGF